MVDLPKLVVAGHKATSARTFVLCIGARVLRNAEEEREEAVATMGLIPNEVVFREAHKQYDEELDDNEETQVTNLLYQLLGQQLRALALSRKPLVNFGFKHVPDSPRQVKVYLILHFEVLKQKSEVKQFLTTLFKGNWDLEPLLRVLEKGRLESFDMFHAEAFRWPVESVLGRAQSFPWKRSSSSLRCSKCPTAG